MIAHVSRDEDIWPGDVYGSGTPGGCCGLDLGRELQPGDVVELEIEKIGSLTNTIGFRPG
jgi:2-keto-4-pentenoate hydratase/2-oxohepta-3-ene-1,7-dioic acid hydratase in catechol pathway